MYRIWGNHRIVNEVLLRSAQTGLVSIYMRQIIQFQKPVVALVVMAGLLALPGEAPAATPQANAIKDAQTSAPVASSRARKYQGSRGGAR